MQSAFQELYLSFVLIAVNESHGGIKVQSKGKGKDTDFMRLFIL